MKKKTGARSKTTRKRRLLKVGIACYPTFGGSGIVATELGRQLACRGYEVHFISLSLPYRMSRFTKNVFFHEVVVEPYPLLGEPVTDRRAGQRRPQHEPRGPPRVKIFEAGLSGNR